MIQNASIRMPLPLTERSNLRTLQTIRVTEEEYNFCCTTADRSSEAMKLIALYGHLQSPVYFRDSFGDNEEGCLLALQEHLARGRESRHPGFHHPYHTASTLSTGLSYLSPR